MDLKRPNAIQAASGFFEPVVVRGLVVAVLVVAWRFMLPVCPEHFLRLMPLLAADAGVTISREDHIETLNEQAAATGLTNRRTADAGLVRHLAHASRTGHQLCVAVLDVNGLKGVIDTEGHEARDALLRRAATVWRGALRREDQLARIGGDEFVLVMADTDAAEAERAVLRPRATAPEVSVAVGVAQRQGHQEAKDLLDLADRSMHEDKQLQRGPGRHPPPEVFEQVYESVSSWVGGWRHASPGRLPWAATIAGGDAEGVICRPALLGARPARPPRPLAGPARRVAPPGLVMGGAGGLLRGRRRCGPARGGVGACRRAAAGVTAGVGRVGLEPTTQGL